jgi:hypothetical protein
LWSVIQIGIIERGKKNKRTNLWDAKEHRLQFEENATLGGPKNDEDSIKLLGKEMEV